MWSDHKKVQCSYLRIKKVNWLKTRSRVKNMFTKQQEGLQLITKHLLFCSLIFVYLLHNGFYDSPPPFKTLALWRWVYFKNYDAKIPFFMFTRRQLRKENNYLNCNLNSTNTEIMLLWPLGQYTIGRI